LTIYRTAEPDSDSSWAAADIAAAGSRNSNSEPSCRTDHIRPASKAAEQPAPVPVRCTYIQDCNSSQGRSNTGLNNNRASRNTAPPTAHSIHDIAVLHTTASHPGNRAKIHRAALQSCARLKNVRLPKSDLPLPRNDFRRRSGFHRRPGAGQARLPESTEPRPPRAPAPWMRIYETYESPY